MIPVRHFSFDGNSGVVRELPNDLRGVDARENADWKVCTHLRAALAEQLKHDARIVDVTGAGTWGLIDLDISLGAVNSTVLSNTLLPTQLKLWTNTDPHYPLQSGLSCAECRQTLSWPTTR